MTIAVYFGRKATKQTKQTHGAMGWSAVCVVVVFAVKYSLFCVKTLNKTIHL